MAKPGDCAGDLKPDQTVEASLLYCMKHSMQDGDTPAHTQPLFSQQLLGAWKEHYSRLLPQQKVPKVPFCSLALSM